IVAPADHGAVPAQSTAVGVARAHLDEIGAGGWRGLAEVRDSAAAVNRSPARDGAIPPQRAGVRVARADLHERSFVRAGCRIGRGAAGLAGPVVAPAVDRTVSTARADMRATRAHLRDAGGVERAGVQPERRVVASPTLFRGVAVPNE